MSDFLINTPISFLSATGGWLFNIQGTFTAAKLLYFQIFESMAKKIECISNGRFFVYSQKTTLLFLEVPPCSAKSGDFAEQGK
jgi:hypothetical protein